MCVCMCVLIRLGAHPTDEQRKGAPPEGYGLFTNIRLGLKDLQVTHYIWFCFFVLYVVYEVAEAFVLDMASQPGKTN
jgi:hypothetical protein